MIRNLNLLLFLQIKSIIFENDKTTETYKSVHVDSYFNKQENMELSYYFPFITKEYINSLKDSIVSLKLNGMGVVFFLKIGEYLIVGELDCEMDINLLDDINKSKSEFISNMSHEFRTPLNGIVGMTQILKDTELSKQQKFCVNNIEKCNFDLLSLVNDILDYSKLDNGSLRLDIKPFNLKNCIESSIDINISKIRETGNNIQVEIEKGVPEYILGDYQRLKQILVNLLNNSLKFTKKGHVAITVKTLSVNEPDYTLLNFNISDTGLGIPNDIVHKLFKPFIQAKNGYREGTGLGLVICKKLCKLMGGDISILNTVEGKGTSVSFDIKVNKIHNNYNSEYCDKILKDKYILIVDDNEVNRLSLLNLCNKWGMMPVICSNYNEALFYSEKYEYYCGLIDIVMPEISGIELARKLIEDKKISYPLIGLSSLKEIPKESENLFLHFLFKPVREEVIKEILLNIKNDFEYSLSENDDKNSFRNLKILVVDDVYLNRQILEIFLTKININKNLIKHAINGKEALDIIKSEEFDYVFLDIKMPDISGVEVYSYILKNNLKRKTKYIAMTAYITEKEEYYTSELKFDNCIYKPITDKNILSRIII